VTPDLNLRLLRYFVAVVDEGHFGRAAAKLFITPPALTQQVRRLEREVGFELLDRSARPVVPTPAGALFLHEVRNVLDAAQRAALVVESHARRATDRFALGFVATPMGRLTRRLIETFGGQAGPDVLRLVELPLADQTEAVFTGRVDASLAWSPVADPRLRLEPAVTAARVAALAIDHRLAGRESIRVDELNADTYLALEPELVDEAWNRWWAIDPRPDGSPVRYGPRGHTFMEVVESVAVGRGVFLTSELLSDAYARRDVVFVPIEDAEPTQLLLCTRRDDTSPRTRLMREVVRSLGAQDGCPETASGHR
jgi:DNA-binding transcriptional LysR family regulator